MESELWRRIGNRAHSCTLRRQHMEHPERAYADEFVVNDPRKICHRGFCQSARLMGKGWRLVTNPAQAREGGCKECSNCLPYHVITGDIETKMLHMYGCRIAASCTGEYFETVEDAYRAGFSFRGCCVPPGMWEFEERLMRKLDREEE